VHVFHVIPWQVSTGDNVTIHFPRESYLSVSTTHVIQPWDWEAEKVGSLKYFEVHGVQEKEPRFHDWTRQAGRHDHLPEEVSTHCPIGLSILAPDRVS
jgi:hypothetical protein